MPSLMSENTMIRRPLGVCILLYGLSAGLAQTAETVSAAAPEREPEIRHLDRQKDRADLKRIWHYRKLLPEPFYRRNNFGWA